MQENMFHGNFISFDKPIERIEELNALDKRMHQWKKNK
jgi:hypothetical protein